MFDDNVWNGFNSKCLTSAQIHYHGVGSANEQYRMNRVPTNVVAHNLHIHIQVNDMNYFNCTAITSERNARHSIRNGRFRIRFSNGKWSVNSSTPTFSQIIVIIIIITSASMCTNLYPTQTSLRGLGIALHLTQSYKEHSFYVWSPSLSSLLFEFNRNIVSSLASL